MKKTFSILITLVMMSVNVFADGLTATLQQGDKMTPFYGVDAFKNAYAAADSGAVITLSAGLFNEVDTIKKSVNIIGSYAFNVNDVHTTLLEKIVISAGDVKIEGIYFKGNVYLEEISNCWIIKSWVEGTLTSTKKHLNSVVDQCVIKSDAAISTGINYCIKNSTINQFSKSNTTTNLAYIVNCAIYSWYTKPFAVYKNCLLNGSGTLTSPSEFYYNQYSGSVTYSNGCVNANNKASKSFSTSSYPCNIKDGDLGQDGTPKGPYGGTGFSEWPSIPRVIESNIANNTDADGKLNVSFKVVAQ